MESQQRKRLRRQSQNNQLTSLQTQTASSSTTTNSSLTGSPIGFGGEWTEGGASEFGGLLGGRAVLAAQALRTRTTLASSSTGQRRKASQSTFPYPQHQAGSHRQSLP